MGRPQMDPNRSSRRLSFAGRPRRLASPIVAGLLFPLPKIRNAGRTVRTQEGVMLTRRGFAGFASCALCAITGFIATEASAQGTPPPSGGVNRKILSKSDGPAAGYETVLVEAEIAAGGGRGRAPHPRARVG